MKKQQTKHQMTKINISKLTDAALDWAVAKCEGFTDYDPATEKMLPPRKEYGWVSLCEYHFSTDWSQGGPIIERERISPTYSLMHKDWQAAYHEGRSSFIQSGPTPLIAAMRCFVTSRLGDTIEVPDELIGE